jgi:hypothetical protein
VSKLELLKEIIYCFSDKNSSAFFAELSRNNYRIEQIHSSNLFWELFYKGDGKIWIININDLESEYREKFLEFLSHSASIGILLDDSSDFQNMNLTHWEIIPKNSSISFVIDILQKKITPRLLNVNKLFYPAEAGNNLLVYSTLTSFSQGAGPGTTVALLNLLETVVEKQDDYYKVPAEIYELIIENNAYTVGIIKGMNRMFKLYSEKIEILLVDLDEFLLIVETIFKETAIKFTEKNISFEIEKGKLIDSFQISIDVLKMKIALEELIMNAYSFCIPNSMITLELIKVDELFKLSLSNEIQPSFYEGIPREKEKLVILPFIKNYPPLEEVMKISRFGIGLGLTAVEWIIRNSNGVFRIYNKDSNIDEKRKFVQADIFLQLGKG